MKVYILGSLRNPRVPEVAALVRKAGHQAFDDWYSPGPETDEKWQEYEKARGRSYKEALLGEHAEAAFQLDKRNLDTSEAAILGGPYGKSAMAEMGYLRGRGVPVYVLLDGEPERFDLMLKFANSVHYDPEEIIHRLDASQTLAHLWGGGT